MLNSFEEIISLFGKKLITYKEILAEVIYEETVLEKTIDPLINGIQLSKLL